MAAKRYSEAIAKDTGSTSAQFSLGSNQALCKQLLLPTLDSKPCQRCGELAEAPDIIYV